MKALTRVIAGHLTDDGWYLEKVPAENKARVEIVRQAGRMAGRELRRKVRTVVSPPTETDEPTVNVMVVVIDEDPDMEQMRAAAESAARFPAG